MASWRYALRPKDSRVDAREVMATSSSDLGWDVESRQLPRSFARSMQFYSDKTKTSLKFYALFAYPAYVGKLNVIERRMT